MVKSTKKLPRRDTSLESEGAEFLVLANLLIEKIPCYKAYTNFPGYDLVAMNPVTAKTARIQVKSRWNTDYDKTFPIHNWDCEFVVHVALNRGLQKDPASRPDLIRPPVCYVFPVEIAKTAWNEDDKLKKVKITKIPVCEKYINAWHLIAEYLNETTA